LGHRLHYSCFVTRSTDARVFSLDVLRGLAIALVLFRHIPVKPTSDETLSSFLFNIGWTGVDLFFVLSGFLISRLLFREIQTSGTCTFVRFWIRRSFKIWPSYFILFLPWSVLVTGLRAQHSVAPEPGQLSNLVFLQNYFPEHVRWPHSWSLAVEEHFYLAFPLMLLVLVRARALHRFPLLVTCVCTTLFILRWTLVSPELDWTDFYYSTHLRADSLLFGTLLGYGQTFHNALFERIGRWKAACISTAAATLGLAGLYPLGETAFSYTALFTLLYISYGAVVTTAATVGISRTIPARALAWLGTYSYTIYIAHAVVGATPGFRRVLRHIAELTIDTPWVDRVVFWSLSIGLGYCASRMIEQPFLRLRERFAP
jgi:peptidoglycan/LPS O-acetylase OafA/YrhL